MGQKVSLKYMQKTCIELDVKTGRQQLHEMADWLSDGMFPSKLAEKYAIHTFNIKCLCIWIANFFFFFIMS